MEKYEYMLVRWETLSIVKDISTFSASGDEKKYEVGFFSEGESEFTKVMNELSQNGWQIMDSTYRTDYSSPIKTGTIYIHLQRKIS
ncbi:MAG: hypothetical protein AB9897_05970 [Anaerolineaceae bacterium]